MSELDDLVAKVRAAIVFARIPLSDEKNAQIALAVVLERAGIEHQREHRLGLHDIPDFFCPPGLVIEVKMKGARAAEVYRQLARYALYPEVGAILLVTNRAMGLPESVHGKPAYFTSLGRAWL